MKLTEKLIEHFYLPRLKSLDREIGCKLVFHYVPDRFINAIMNTDMTQTWKNFGLDIIKGKNHFTVGKITHGKSTRFDPDAQEYQAWLGGYTVKLASEKMLTVEDHFKLAIADQNSWLKWYEDPKPMTITEGFKPVKVGDIALGKYTGELYEFGGRTHSDVGFEQMGLRLFLAAQFQSASYNLANPNLHLNSGAFVPEASLHPYEILDLKGYIGIFNIESNVKVVLYGNGTDKTFPIIKDDLLKALQSCEIVEV